MCFTMEQHVAITNGGHHKITIAMQWLLTVKLHLASMHDPVLGERCAYVFVHSLATEATCHSTCNVLAVRSVVGVIIIMMLKQQVLASVFCWEHGGRAHRLAF